MCKTHWNPQHALVLAGEPHRFPPSKAWRTLAQVYSDIENLSLDDAHQFSLRMVQLIMQSAQDISRRGGMIVLYKRGGNPNISHDSLVVALEEITALISKHPRFEDEY